MAGETPPELQAVQRDATGIVRLGRWLFRHRTATAIPLVLALLGIRIGTAPASPVLMLIGVGVVAVGEAMRLWSVRHIGAISRTRSDRLGPLIESGPFARLRNPLYLGNIMLWVGFAVSARLIWLAPIIALVLVLEYHAIVSWEEYVLDARLGAPYRAYLVRVPRWIPTLRSATRESARRPYSWNEIVFSERGTLVAIAVGYLLLWIKETM